MQPNLPVQCYMNRSQSRTKRSLKKKNAIKWKSDAWKDICDLEAGLLKSLLGSCRVSRNKSSSIAVRQITITTGVFSIAHPETAHL